MPSVYFRVIQTGPEASLQDAGRFGVRHLGLTQGGNMDWIAAASANQLLGNPANAACIEVLLGGLVLEAQQDAWISIAGADSPACIDDHPITGWQVSAIKAGQRLSLGYATRGLRCYIGLAGGGWLGEQSWFNSWSCVKREQLGGHLGSGALLGVGDQLLGSSQAHQAPPPCSPLPCELTQFDYAQTTQLAVLLGAQSRDFAGRSLFDAFNRPWQVSQRANRMGIRLEGPRLVYRGAGLISEGVSLGGIQVPADGQPFVLMNDRQTIGGYPRLGALTPFACAVLAQKAPGQCIGLTPTSEHAALSQLRKLHRTLTG